mmetsp:Transcript_32140/g.46332  ORF Transcript_32140/g.46332 Transcript_32140/m.46332 type:complete len:494 (-) Transcript_32140:2389-3870(-)
MNNADTSRQVVQARLDMPFKVEWKMVTAVKSLTSIFTFNVRSRVSVLTRLSVITIIATLSYMALAERDRGTIKSPVYRGGITYSTQELQHKFGQHRNSKSSVVQSLQSISSPFCSGQQTVQHSVKMENDSIKSHVVRELFADPLCEHSPCPSHSFCFLGTCVCHPGYSTATDCKNRSHPANPWYTDYCPNLQAENGETFDINTPLHKLGGEYRNYKNLRKSDQQKAECVMTAKVTTVGVSYVHKYCAYLCYSHPTYGVATVPTSLWRAAQTAEGDLWRSVGQSSSEANDRAEEHWVAFESFQALQHGISLGEVVEVGAGPWTQLKGILHVRSDLIVEKFTVWEPGAQRYMSEVPTCSYKSGKSLMKWETNAKEQFHPFPVDVTSDAGELLTRPGSLIQYDTLISINVLEHVQDAFRYLTGLYMSLRHGGLLIFHERYYDTHTLTDGDLYHPVRITKHVLDKFLSGFKVIYNNCSAMYGNRRNEKGYYVLATKI